MNKVFALNLSITNSFAYEFLLFLLTLSLRSTGFFETTVGKGEIAPNEKFLLSPQWF